MVQMTKEPKAEDTEDHLPVPSLQGLRSRRDKGSRHQETAVLGAEVTGRPGSPTPGKLLPPSCRALADGAVHAATCLHPHPTPTLSR